MLVIAVGDDQTDRPTRHAVIFEGLRLRENGAQQDNRLVVERSALVGVVVRAVHLDRLVERYEWVQHEPVEVPAVREHAVPLLGIAERVEDDIVSIPDGFGIARNESDRAGVVGHHRDEADFTRRHVVDVDADPELDLLTNVADVDDAHRCR